MPTPPPILELVDRFARNLESYVGPDYKETQLRREFLDPFFEALGWDVQNRKGYAEAYKEVIHEDTLRIGGVGTSAPDYSFRIGGTRKFFVEAKKPSIRIKDDPEPALQLRRYSWSEKLPLGIVTDFHEFAIYETRGRRPLATDKASVGRVFYCTFEDYPRKWDEIAAIFSLEAVWRGSFDKFAASTRGKRGTEEFDTAFLKDMEHWRELLARNLALRNTLPQRDLNFAVQRILDRLIFLRIAEDRGIEKYGQLLALTSGPRLYARFCDICRRADLRYNSGLFHFAPERNRAEAPDKLTLGLDLDDAVIKEIIDALYWPKSSYAFAVVPADILGHVYEQFLGKVIQLTEGGHRIRVEEKPEVRKAGGVYYTPTYIVDYIVRQTVGPLVEGRTPKQVEKLRVLDPACGSGSFLLGAFEFLLDWHLRYYLEHDPASWAKKKNPPIYETAPNAGGIGRGSKNWLLTTAERKRILTNNLYGVDIDVQAVEVTKLSLLLKVLEGEARELQGRQMDFHRVLPDLGTNIKCGNSLIGSDFYAQPDLPLFDDEARIKLNAFDWEHEFPEIMRAGGFDAVIGNPPWGAEFREEELSYLRRRHERVIARMIDSYIYFIDQSVRLASQQGLIGLVVPSNLINQVDTLPTRRVLLARGIAHLVNLGQGVFGSKVLNTSTIFVSDGRKHAGAVVTADLSSARSNEEKRSSLTTLKAQPRSEWCDRVLRDAQFVFFAGSFRGSDLLLRLQNAHPKLGSHLKNGIQRGVSPDIVAAHVVSRSEARTSRLEQEILRPSVSGSQIRPWQPWQIDQFVLYTNRETRITDFPNALRHLERFRSQNTCREVTEGKHPFWALHRPRDPAIFSEPKLIGITTAKTIKLIFDEAGTVFVTDAMYLFSVRPGVSPKALMALMQSRAFLFLYRVSNQGESRVIPQIKAAKLEPLPVPTAVCDGGKSRALAAHADRMLQLHTDLASAKSPDAQMRLQREIDATDRAIDALVYELYELTPDEIRLVEEATAPQVAPSEAAPEPAPAPGALRPEDTVQSEADAAHFYFVKEDPPAEN